MKLFIYIFIFCLFLSACGLKGPLYESDNQTAKLMFSSSLFYRVA